MTRFYFIRHGLSQLNVEWRFAGHTDTPLTEEGKKQAIKAGKKAKKLEIDHIISSPLSRAYDTAKLIAKEIDYPIKNIEINPLFIERNLGAMENQPYKPDIDFDGIADAESTDQLTARAKLAIDYLSGLHHKKILVVSHGAIGRSFRQILSDEPVDFNAPIKNSEIIEWLIL